MRDCVTGIRGCRLRQMRRGAAIPGVLAMALLVGSAVSPVAATPANAGTTAQLQGQSATAAVARRTLPDDRLTFKKGGKQTGVTPMRGRTWAGTTATSMPVGDLTNWKQIYAEDFNRTAALGSFLRVYANTFDAYPVPWRDTSGNGAYDPARTLSASGGLMDIWLHTVNGVPLVSAPQPRLFGSRVPGRVGQTYGRYSVRFRSSLAPGYKTAWLLWPDSELIADGEIDFPEGNLDGTPFSAFAHYTGGTGTQQDWFLTTSNYLDWHVATIEWTPGQVKFILDDVTIGISTTAVPSKPMHWVLQTETNLDGTKPDPAVSGHVQVDWVVAYRYVP